jgi:hypothetical protein
VEVPVAPPAPSNVVVVQASTQAHCFAAGEVGAISLDLPGGSVSVDVVPGSSFPQIDSVALAAVDPASAPNVPGLPLGGLIFQVSAQDGCDGVALAQLPASVNLGIGYQVSANAPGLVIAELNGDQWVPIPAVIDPSGNPYISGTIQYTGTYAVYQTS